MENNQAVNQAIREELAGHAENREKLGRLFGMEQRSALDELDRADFGSDEEFLTAATKLEMEKATPEFRATRARLAREWKARNEKAQREAEHEQYQQIRKSVSLDAYDVKVIDQEAGELARRDLSAGKIGTSDLAAAIERHAKELKEKRLDQKASSELFNSVIRGKWRGY